MSHIGLQEMFEYLVGEVTKVRAEEIDAHLAACQTCRTQLDQQKGMIELIDAPDDELEKVDLATRVRELAKAHREVVPRKVNLRPAIIGLVGAIVVILGAATIWMTSRENEQAYRTKSSGTTMYEQDRWVALKAYRLGESGQATSLGNRMKVNDFLLFAYTNIGQQPKKYMMIFALDSLGSVHWFHPAYINSKSDPLSMSIYGNVADVELPEKIRHNYAPGPLWIYALFTDEPLNVSVVETMVGKLKPGIRIPLENSAQHILTTVVRP
jgi:hypothetical protein